MAKLKKGEKRTNAREREKEGEKKGSSTLEWSARGRFGLLIIKIGGRIVALIGGHFRPILIPGEDRWSGFKGTREGEGGGAEGVPGFLKCRSVIPDRLVRSVAN